MESRRVVMMSLVNAAAITSLVRARAADAMFPGPVTDDTPKATVIKGTPPVLDFGDGTRIPCDKSAFLTLWEGRTFWLTFGAGRSSYRLRAQGEAVLFAMGAMKALLMTLAFAPERLDHVNGGWKLKVQDPKNYVLGDVMLPGKPYWPINDADFTGFGDSDSSGLSGPMHGSGGMGSGPTQGNAGGGPSSGPSVASDLLKVDAFTSYVVLKKKLSLEDVRRRAQLLVQ
ncbi:MAG: hypothetical protein KGJ78_02755 [Alphaproteobacteria bacterium]|nr:hypothetical protein [Alphaproteobacteria bacterium]